MPPLFFFSYARDDSANSDKVKKFFDELVQEVRKRGGFGADAGFFDATDIKTGDSWPESVAQGLRLAKVFVFLTSPTYVQKEFCGKELQVFIERWQAYRATLQNPLAHPSILLPVVWIPLRGAIPEPLASYQLHDNSLPEEYRLEGLEYLMRLNTKQDQYEEFKIRFADKIIAAAKENDLRGLAALRAFDKIQSAFLAAMSGAAAGPPVAEAGGPKSARFIFVAATRPQIASVKQQVEAYDGQSGFHWRPFHPQEDTVGYFAMEAALQQRIQYNELSFGQDLAQQLEQAHRENSIVLVLLDAWTLKVEPYQSWMRPYDRVSLPNCALLVPWNDGDAETVAQRTILQDHLQVTLPAKFLSRPSLFFRDASSAEELRQTLRDTLTQIQMKILEVGEAKKRIEATASASLPTLPVPGARVE